MFHVIATSPLTQWLRVVEAGRDGSIIRIAPVVLIMQAW